MPPFQPLAALHPVQTWEDTKLLLVHTLGRAFGNTGVTADEEQRSTSPIVGHRAVPRHWVTLRGDRQRRARLPTYEKETFEFCASLQMTSRRTLLRCRGSTRARMPRSPSLWFSARPFVRPILPCPERDNCGRLSSIGDSSNGIGLSFSGGTIITAVGVTYRTCDLRRRGPLLWSTQTLVRWRIGNWERWRSACH